MMLFCGQVTRRIERRNTRLTDLSRELNPGAGGLLPTALATDGDAYLSTLAVLTVHDLCFIK